MLKAEEQMELVILKKHGESIRSLTRSTGRSRNTVRRYLRGGDAAATRKPAPKRVEKLDPYKKYIVERMAAAAPQRLIGVQLAEREPQEGRKIRSVERLDLVSLTPRAGSTVCRLAHDERSTLGAALAAYDA